MTTQLIARIAAVRMPAASLREVLAILAEYQAPADPVMELRRERDRERKRLARSGMSADIRGLSADSPRTGADKSSPPSSPFHPPPTPTPEHENAGGREAGELFPVPEKPKGKATLAEWLAYSATLTPPFPPLEAERAWNHYEGNGWRTGKNPVKNWQACCRTCHSTWKLESHGNNHRTTHHAPRIVTRNTAPLPDGRPSLNDTAL